MRGCVVRCSRPKCTALTASPYHHPPACCKVDMFAPQIHIKVSHCFGYQKRIICGTKISN